MVRRAALAVLALAAGCSDTSVSSRFGGLSVSQVQDFGTFAVGLPHVIEIELTVNTANVNLNNLQIGGDYTQFFYTVRAYEEKFPEAELPEGIAGFGLPQNVGVNEDYRLPLIYVPTSEGYHDVRFTIVSDARQPETVVTGLARADTPEALIVPRLLDFGKVPAGSLKTKGLRIFNRSDLELAITATTSDPQFMIDEALPFLVPPNDDRLFEITFEAVTDQPVREEQAVFRIGDQPILPNIKLRANDCQNGSPEAYNEDGDGFTTCGGDCDDNDPDVYPGAPETSVNGKDNDCDGLIDEGTIGADDDGDGYCDTPMAPGATCSDGSLPGDCNDGDPFASPDPANSEDRCPGPADICSDGFDNDCDGVVDGGTEDKDGDGYTLGADPPDCDDQDAQRFPGNREIPDGKDNDCDGVADEGTVLRDDDGDGYREGLPGQPSCTDGAIANPPDCNDAYDPLRPTGPHPGENIFPGAPEQDTPEDEFRFIDNDCDGSVDEFTDWADDDGDGYTEEAGDCDDDDPGVGPGELEIVGNGIDDDCNPATPAVGEE